MTRAPRGPVLLALGLAWLSPVAPAAPLTPQERRGKALYLRGASEHDEGALAYLRGADMEVPAAVMPCANCHGRDGRGKVEGSVNAPDITWAQLTRRAAHAHAGGRTHRRHGVLTLGSAIARGVDPDGHGLDAAMPVYRFSPAGLDALVAYLQRLGGERDPGIEAGRLVVGTVAPAGLAAAREAQAVWRELFDDVNASGGIHGRRLELRVAEAAPGASGVAASVKTLLGDDGVFALLGVFVAEPSDDLAALLGEHEAPLIGPFTPHPRRRRPPERETFYLAAGLVDQGHALLKTLRARAPAAARLALLWPDEPGGAAAAEELAAEAGRLGLGVVVKGGRARVSLASAATLAELRAASADVLLLPGWRGEERALLEAADAAGFRPHVLLPGYAGGAAALDLPAAFDQRVLLGLGLPPFDPARTADELARRLFAGSARRPSPTALLAFRAGRLLVEGLRRAGRDVNRDAFMTALEGLYDFDLGVGPRVSFGPNRRSGAPGAHVVALDLKQRRFVPLGEWTGADGGLGGARSPSPPRLD